MKKKSAHSGADFFFVNKLLAISTYARSLILCAPLPGFFFDKVRHQIAVQFFNRVWRQTVFLRPCAALLQHRREMFRRLCRALERVEITDYTVIDDARGKGDRGVRGNDELSDVFKNSLLLTTCAPESLDRVLEVVRPILQRFGGMCLVSDAHSLTH